MNSSRFLQPFWLAQLVLVFCFSLSAAEWPKLKEFSIEEPEVGRIRIYSIVTETNKYEFLPPANARVHMEEPSKKVLIHCEEPKLLMTLYISTNYATGLPSGDLLREKVLDLYPGGKVLQTNSCRTGLGEGWSIDIEQPKPHKWSTTARHVIVPVPGGSAEVTMNGLTDDFHARPYLFTQLLGSLQMKPLLQNK